MIRYYESACTQVNGACRPVANVTAASRTWIAYNADCTLSGTMAEVTAGQDAAIIASGGIPKTQAEIAAIYPFPAAWPPPPQY